MAKQLVFTSVLRGLDPGRSGYCTVARHRDLRERLVPEIERLSAYHHVNYTYGDGVLNPVVMAFRTITLGETRYHIFTRIVDAGFDYSRRSNYLAHHLIVEEKEITGGITPADIFLGWNGWLDKWEGEPRFYGPADDVSLADMLGATQPALPAQNWAAAAGDAGAAAAPLDAAPRQGFAFAVRPGSERVLLSLYRESAALLPVHERWKLGFTTYLQETDRPNEFRWAGHWPDHQPISASGWTVLDLRQAGLVPAPAGLAAERARVGEKPKLVPPRATTLTPPKAEPAAKKWDLAKPPGASAAPRSRTVILSQEDVPSRSRWKWPVMAASVLVILGLLVGGGFWFMKSSENAKREEEKKKRYGADYGKNLTNTNDNQEKGPSEKNDSSPPQPVAQEGKAGVVGAEASDKSESMREKHSNVGQSLASTTQAETGGTRSANDKAIQEVTVESPKGKTYVFFRRSNTKLICGLFQKLSEKNPEIEILRNTDGWVGATVSYDPDYYSIKENKRSEEHEPLVISVKMADWSVVDPISTNLLGIKINDDRILIFDSKTNVWPRAQETSLNISRTKHGTLCGFSGITVLGVSSELKLRFDVGENVKNAAKVLSAADTISGVRKLREYLKKQIDDAEKNKGTWSIDLISGQLGFHIPENEIVESIAAYQQNLSGRNYSDENLKVKISAENQAREALFGAVILPVVDKEKMCEGFNKLSIGPNTKLVDQAKLIVPLVLGPDYMFVSFNSRDDELSLEPVLKKAEELAWDKVKAPGAKAVRDAVGKIIKLEAVPKDQISNSKTWVTSVLVAIGKYKSARKEREDYEKSLSNYKAEGIALNKFNEFWIRLQRFDITEAQIYMIYGDGGEIELGKVPDLSAK